MSAHGDRVRTMTLRLKAFLAIATLSVALWVGIVSGGLWAFRSLTGDAIDSTMTASVR